MLIKKTLESAYSIKKAVLSILSICLKCLKCLADISIETHLIYWSDIHINNSYSSPQHLTIY